MKRVHFEIYWVVYTEECTLISGIYWIDYTDWYILSEKYWVEYNILSGV